MPTTKIRDNGIVATSAPPTETVRFLRPSDVTAPPFPVDVGGTADADAAAHNAAWETVVDHLRPS